VLRVFETFAGIGAQRKALEILKQKINLDYKIVATSEWDIYANISYNAIHFDNDIEISKVKTIDEMKDFLKKFEHSKDSKEKISDKSLDKLSDEIIIKLYSSYKNSNNLGNILKINIDQLVELDINMITYSFPCQDLSSAGKNKGMSKEENTRSGLLWEIDRILNELKKIKKLPKFLFLENVRNMISSKHKNDYKLWLERLHNDYGYNTQTYLLDANDFGIPQKRKRLYAISVLDEISFIDTWFSSNRKKILEKFDKPNFSKDTFIKFQNLNDILKIDYENQLYEKEALESIPNWTRSREEMLYDNPILFYNKLNNRKIKKELLDSFKDTLKNLNEQYYADSTRTITTKQDRNPNSGNILLLNTKLEILEPLIINKTKSIYRFLTPREVYLLMGFTEEDFNKVIVNKFITKEKLYRQAGNSIVVNVLIYLFKNINELYLKRKEEEKCGKLQFEELEQILSTI